MFLNYKKPNINLEIRLFVIDLGFPVEPSSTFLTNFNKWNLNTLTRPPTPSHPNNTLVSTVGRSSGWDSIKI